MLLTAKKRKESRKGRKILTQVFAIQNNNSIFANFVNSVHYKKRLFLRKPGMGGRIIQTPESIRDKNRKHKINDEIQSQELRVVDEQGTMLGVMTLRQALDLAYTQEKDLVEIAPQAAPPVCRIIDYGKFAYEQQKRENQAKKAQHKQQLKEIRFKWRTDTHDFEFKRRHAQEFLEDGHKVKATVMFRGREIVHKEIGEELLKRFIASLESCSKIDQPVHSEGRTITAILAPDKAKAK